MSCHNRSLNVYPVTHKRVRFMCQFIDLDRELTTDEALTKLLDAYGIPSIDDIEEDPMPYVGMGYRPRDEITVEAAHSSSSTDRAARETSSWKWLPVSAETRKRVKFMCRYLDPRQKLTYDQAINELLDAYGIPTFTELEENPSSHVGSASVVTRK